MTGDGTRGKLTMTIPTVGEMREIITPDGNYVDTGSLLGVKLPDGKRWLFVSAESLGKPSGAGLQDLRGDSGQTSTQALEYLQATTGDVEKVGEDTVDGTPRRTTSRTSTTASGPRSTCPTRPPRRGRRSPGWGSYRWTSGSTGTTGS